MENETTTFLKKKSSQISNVNSERKIKGILDLITISEPSTIESLESGAKNYTESLRSKIISQNVIGVGISKKISNKKITRNLSLTFYVEKKIPKHRLKEDEIIPPVLNQSLAGSIMIHTDIVELGKMRPQINFIRNPIQPGYSIGHPNITAGTLGAIVTDGKNIYILSNSHVLARSGKAKKGDMIIYPAKYDGGKNPKDAIAQLHKFNKFLVGRDFKNFADCAIAKPIKARLSDITANIKSIGIPKGVIKPKRDMKVVKIGRTTGKTEGKIKDVNFRFILKYDGIGEIGFIDQVLCTRYTEGGDSGSLVIDKESGKAVGLHFAGAKGGSVFSPIGNVLSCLGVKLVTKELAKFNSKPLKKSPRSTLRK